MNKFNPCCQRGKGYLDLRHKLLPLGTPALLRFYARSRIVVSCISASNEICMPWRRKTLEVWCPSWKLEQCTILCRNNSILVWCPKIKFYVLQVGSEMILRRYGTLRVGWMDFGNGHNPSADTNRNNPAKNGFWAASVLCNDERI